MSSRHRPPPSSFSPLTRSLHSRRRRPPLVCPERTTTRLRFRTQESLEEIHYIVHAPPAYHYSLDGFADEEVEENWEAEELTVPELRSALSKRRLPTHGRKMELVERLSAALQQERSERRQDAIEKKRKLDSILSAQQGEHEIRLGTTITTTTTTTAATLADSTLNHHGGDGGDAPHTSTDTALHFSFFLDGLEAGSATPTPATLFNAEPIRNQGDSPENHHSHNNNSSSSSSAAPDQHTTADLGHIEDVGDQISEMGCVLLQPRARTKEEENEMNSQKDELVSKLSRFLAQAPVDKDWKSNSPVSPPPGSSEMTFPTASPPISPMRDRRPLKGVLKKRKTKAPEEMTTNELKEHLIAYGVIGPTLRQKKASLVALLKKRIDQNATQSQ